MRCFRAFSAVFEVFVSGDVVSNPIKKSAPPAAIFEIRKFFRGPVGRMVQGISGRFKCCAGCFYQIGAFTVVFKGFV